MSISYNKTNLPFANVEDVDIVEVEIIDESEEICTICGKGDSLFSEKELSSDEEDRLR